MYKFQGWLLLILSLLFCISTGAQELVSTLNSGNLKVEVYKTANTYSLSFFSGVEKINTFTPDYPITLEVRGKKVNARYNSFVQNGDSLHCFATIVTTRGSEFSVNDLYLASGNGSMELKRKIEVVKVITGDNYFNSLFGFQVATGSPLTAHEFFIPSVWYKGNFDPECHLPSHVPQATDSCFYYREDRITLPLVMYRNKKSGTTICIAHKDAVPNTVMVDNNDDPQNENYQYGALGIYQKKDTTLQTFIYPGSEAERRNGRGVRRHPVEVGVSHSYNLMITFSTTTDYATAVDKSWNETFRMFNPPIYPVNLQTCYDGLLGTLDKYWVPSRDLGGIRDASGWPFQVGLDDFLPRGIDYQMGFVGMQIPTAYYVFRQGMEQSNSTLSKKGESVLNFWANNCLTTLGLPRSWYDPGLNGSSGSFRSDNNMRVCTGGMEGLLTAWCFAKKNNVIRVSWLNACTKFGNWLVTNQNSDGSWYFSYNQQSIANGKHPVTDSNKYLTICGVRYLVELYIATGNEAFKTAALKAGNFCLANINDQYRYVACVVDNPRSIDCESGQMALNGFLSLYDLTKDVAWLKAAEQAGVYVESWVFSYEIPVEQDRTTSTSFPKGRSIIGQHLFAIGHPAADVGFAFSSFGLYRLYLATGKENYLQAARMSAHNTNQSSNWDNSLFPGQAKGLQLEAFSVTLPRRSNGVMTTLNWIYAAHLDPMFRFKDAFGTPDLEEIEKKTLEERQSLVKKYSMVQSSDYGQVVSENINATTIESCKFYPNPVEKNGEISIELSNNNKQNITLGIYSVAGDLVYKENIQPESSKMRIRLNIPSGIYFLQFKGEHLNSIGKLIIK